MNARLVESVAGRSRWAVDEIVDALTAANDDLLPRERAAAGALLLPARDALEAIAADLQASLFPAHFGAADLSPDGMRHFVGHLGRVTIGSGSSVGGNVWLTRDVPAASVVTQRPARGQRFEGGSGI